MSIFDHVSNERKKEIIGVLLMALALFILVSLFTYNQKNDTALVTKDPTVGGTYELFSHKFHNQGGAVGAMASYGIVYLLGLSGFFLPLFLILFGIGRFPNVKMAWIFRKLIYAFTFAMILGIIFDLPDIGSAEAIDFSGFTMGGKLAEVLGKLCFTILGNYGSYILLFSSLIILAALLTPFKPSDSFFVSKRIAGGIFNRGKKWRELRRIAQQRNKRTKEAGKKEGFDQEEDTETNIAVSPEPKEKISTSVSMPPPRKTFKLVRRTEDAGEGNYRFPLLDILDDPPDTKPLVTEQELNETAKILKETLSTFGVEIEGERIEIYPGPVITRYEFKPAAGIKVNQVVNLADDLALAMRARKVRIVAPVPGKAAIGVEIPNRSSQTVYLKEILTSPVFQNAENKLILALGKTSSGEPFATDLGKMPHLLIAGATGSGKSVCINAVITSLLYRLSPEEVRFVMIDPKMLELSVYEGIPHLERSVITNPKLAEHVLSEIVTEMEDRYRRLAKFGVRNIEGFNRKQKKENILPYIVIIVDELADLMMSSSNRVEGLITRLAQMARAVGIHLILATQRPSVDVITGLIKANFSARIAFQVASKIDSRTILDANGAEKLLGLGDMLFIETGHPEARRIHGAYISSEETSRVVDFIKAQNYAVKPIESLSAPAEEIVIPEEDTENDDDLFRKAVELVIRHKQGSVSLLQRRLAVGYQRAARLIDQLEEEGIVGPYNGSKVREIMVDATFLESEEWKQRRVREKQ
jgi:DNA segregation ATPase FtsK/SpoIIIE, S-DNA-T family